jgi:peroxiredoxin
MNRIISKQWIALILLASLVLSGCGGSDITTGNLTPTISPVVGAQAPDFTISTLDGEMVKLNELRGQPVILNFWATSCAWCRYQMPFLQAAVEEKGHEMEFIAINIGEDIGKVQQYAEGEDLSLIVALDYDRAVTYSYRIGPIPATFFVNERGIIEYVRIGAFQSQAELMAVLEDIY